MRLLADECCSSVLVAALRKSGYDVRHVTEDMPGSDDTEILDDALKDRRILLTEDKDPGDLVFRLGRPAHGIFLMRLEAPDERAKAERLISAIRGLEVEPAGHYVLIEATRTRIRPLLRGVPGTGN